ncbi:MFS transporter [Actinomadura fulvescens]|uniref:MFS transporter n=1 Tax=Actinomadura fulvescens TaxID=46160 RepID=UPI0031E39077
MLNTSQDRARKPGPRRGFRVHRAWPVAAVAFVALIGAAGFRATPGVLMVPLQDEFGWSRATTSLAVSVNLVLFGLTAPFAAALMERFGIRRVTSAALTLVAAGSGLTVFMEASWQLVLCWGVLVGMGTGSMAMVFAATVANRWFTRHRGLVIGVLTAGGATGQLIFLPALAWLVEQHGWRSASVTVAVAALAVVPLVVLVLRERPADVGLLPYGATVAEPEPEVKGDAARVALGALRDASRTKEFWLLAGGFFICGASTNGLVGTHFIPAAHDHGMPETTAAGLLALVGVFDIVGTVASGWLTDRVDSRVLLGWYYALRGLSLLALPVLFGSSIHPSMVVFIVFYGLDWVATVPPTIALTREVFGAARGTIVFGWIFAAHQLGAAVAAAAAGALRTSFGTYTMAWWGAGVICLVAAAMSLSVSRAGRSHGLPEGANP